MIRKIFLLNVVILFIFIFSLEVIARIFHLADLVGVSKNLIIFEKNIHLNAPNIEAIVFSKKVFTDKFGFRVPNKNFSYQKKNASILIIGDSVSFGVGVDEQDTFVGSLRDKFKNINFFNTSVPGYHLKHYSEIIKKNKDLYGLTEVIFFFTLNDISFQKTILNTKDLINGNQSNKNINFFNKLKTNYYFSKINFFLRNKSVLYMWIKGVASKSSERHFYYTFPIYQQDIAIKEIRSEASKLKKVIKENNLKFSIVILPLEFQTRFENCNDHFLQPQSKIKVVFNDLNIKFFDYTKIFCNHNKPSLLFLKYDPVHLSFKGHKLVFNLLKKDLNYLRNL